MIGFSAIQKMNEFRILCASAVLLAMPLDASAEGWLQKKGKALSIYDVSYFSTNDFYNHRGTKQPTDGRFENLAVQTYTEHGWREWMTIIAVGDFRRASQSGLPSGDRRFAIRSSSLALGARLPLKKFDNGIISTRVMVKSPDRHFDSNAVARFRSNFDFEQGVEGGYNFPLWGRHHYVSGSAAYRKRTGSASNQWIFHTIAGFKLSDKIEIMPELDWTLSAGALNDSRLDPAGQNDFTQATASVSGLWHMTDNYSLQIGGRASIYTRSTGAGFSGRVALWRRF